MVKLGLVAGAGGLPLAIARHCQSLERPLFVIRLAGFADADLDAFEGETRPMLDFDGMVGALRRERCQSVCLAGRVDRPNFDNAAAIDPMVSQARGGDDALLTAVVGLFTAAGFVVEGAHEAASGLTLGDGVHGAVLPTARAWNDVYRSLEVARAVGALDIGQGAVCRDGLVFAVEAQEGTDAMLRRVADLIHGRGLAPGVGVLAKASRPGQDLRIDMPTIGPTTVELAASAGLAGIAGEAGRVLVVDRAETIGLADARGLFIVGIPAP